MTTTTDHWVRQTTLGQPRTYQGMLEFFGIPPAAPDRLDDNIRFKRRTWHVKTSSGNPTGRERAKRVVELIRGIEEALKRGADVDLGGGAPMEALPEEVFANLEELWRLVSEYVFADDYERAIRVARRACDQWGGLDSDGAAVLAWVIATGFDTSALINPALLQEGIAAASGAVRRSPAEARNWESEAGLLLAAGRVQEALASTDRATAALPLPTARLCVIRATGMIALDRVDDAAIAAVRAVSLAGNDPAQAAAIRSRATQLLVEWAATHLLPIQSAQALAQYSELVQTAAWCSYGVPEAEDLVRVHRMWAANAGARVFDGSWKLRSFLAVCTGFISLPLHNLARSAPAWQVLLRGLQGRGGEPFWIVASPRYVQSAHRTRFITHLDDI
jgi:hypothetical protein